MIEVTCHYEDGAPILSVLGDVTDADLAVLSTVLDGAEPEHRRVTLDLTRVPALGPDVRRHLLERAARLERQGRTLVVRTDPADAPLPGLPTVTAARAVIEQAKGILMATVGCEADEAFRILVQQSQHENRKLREVAAELVARRRVGFS